MLSAVPDASKVVIASLVDRRCERGYVLFDAQVINPHLATLGTVDIPRREYLAMLRGALAADARPLPRPSPLPQALTQAPPVLPVELRVLHAVESCP